MTGKETIDNSNSLLSQTENKHNATIHSFSLVISFMAVTHLVSYKFCLFWSYLQIRDLSDFAQYICIISND